MKLQPRLPHQLLPQSLQLPFSLMKLCRQEGSSAYLLAMLIHLADTSQASARICRVCWRKSSESAGVAFKTSMPDLQFTLFNFTSSYKFSEQLGFQAKSFLI